MLKLVLGAALLAMASGQADRYPAGVNPHLCPNYPLCDNSVLAAGNSGASVAPQYPQVYGGGRTLPAGVSPGACPNYPYCGAGPQAQQPAHTPYYSPQQNYNPQPNYNSVQQPSYNSYQQPSYNSYQQPANFNNFNPGFNNYNPGFNSQQASGRQYPAGVDPNTCPNYPYCT